MFKSFFIGLIICVTNQQVDLVLPQTVQAQVSAFVPVTATTKGETVVFVSLDPGLNVFPSNLLVDKKTTVVVASKEGRYRLLAYTCLNNVPSQPAFTTIIVGNPAPNPNPPVPVPPNPDPNPPVVDPLFDAVKGIYGGLQESDKAESVRRLKQAYELGVIESDNTSYKTLGDLYQAVRSASVQSLKGDKILPVREVLADELDKVLGTDPNAQLTPELRKKCKDTFARVTKVLGGLNG